MTLVHVGSVKAPDTWSLVLPSTLLPGDIIILGAGVHHATAGFVPSSLPNDFATVYAVDATGTNPSFCMVAWKVAVASDIGRTLDLTPGGTSYPQYSQFVATVLRGMMVSAIAGYSANAVAETGPITVSTKIRRLIFFVAMQSGVAPEALAIPAGYSSLFRGVSGQAWHNSAMYLADADEGPGVLPSVVSGWGAVPSSGVSIALAILPNICVGRSVVSANLRGGRLSVAATSLGASVVLAMLFKVVSSVGGYIEQPFLQLGGDINSIQIRAIRPPISLGQGSLEPVSAGSGPPPPPPPPPAPTTGQLWPRGDYVRQP